MVNRQFEDGRCEYTEPSKTRTSCFTRHSNLNARSGRGPGRRRLPESSAENVSLPAKRVMEEGDSNGLLLSYFG